MQVQARVIVGVGCSWPISFLRRPIRIGEYASEVGEEVWWSHSFLLTWPILHPSPHHAQIEGSQRSRILKEIKTERSMPPRGFGRGGGRGWGGRGRGPGPLGLVVGAAAAATVAAVSAPPPRRHEPAVVYYDTVSSQYGIFDM